MDMEKVGQANVDPENISRVGFDVEGKTIDAVLLPYRGTEDYEVGVKESTNSDGDRSRLYLKLPKRVREAGHVAVEYYHDHETLAKGVAKVGAVAGIITVGSLVVMRLKKRKG